MDLEWQKQIIEDLIKENPGSTIGDYLELIAELQGIETENQTDKQQTELVPCEN